MDCNFFGQFITNKTNLYPLNKSSNIIVEKLGCQNCVIVHIGNVNHDMALNQIRKKKKKTIKRICHLKLGCLIVIIEHFIYKLGLHVAKLY